MSKTTRATQALEAAGVAFTVHSYDYDPDAPRIGLQAAEALGEDPSRVLKTLMAEVDGKPVCVVVPSDQEVSMKKLAAAFGGKAANMMKAPDARAAHGVCGRRHQSLRPEEGRADRDGGDGPCWRIAST